MGSITSRGNSWPPKPYKRRVVRNEPCRDANNQIIPGKYYTVEDYVWVYPGAEIQNGCGGVAWVDGEEASAGQETAIRNLEDG